MTELLPGPAQAAVFATAVFVLNATPGVDFLLTVSRTLQGGLRAGVAAALGISAGCGVHALAAARPDASIGTVLSSVPWMISVGTVKARRSPRKSVLANEFAQASVAFRLACIAMPRAHCSNSSLTGRAMMPTPKKSLKKPAKNFARSSLMTCAIVSNTACSVPSDPALDPAEHPEPPRPTEKRCFMRPEPAITRADTPARLQPNDLPTDPT